MKPKAYFITAIAAAALSTLLFLGRNVISSQGIIYTVAAVFIIAGALTLIAGMRIRTNRITRLLTLTTSVAAIVGGGMLLWFTAEAALMMPAVMSVSVAAAAVWQAILPMRAAMATNPHRGWLLIAPALLIAAAVYLWLLPAQPESDPAAMTAMGISLAVIALACTAHGFLLRHTAQTAQKSSLTPLQAENPA